MPKRDSAKTSKSVAADSLVPEAMEKDAKFVSTIGRAFEILRAFKPGGGPLGNAELSAATQIPKATVSRLTHTLTALGYLNHIESSGKYEPSASILALGYCVLTNTRIRQLARDDMQLLANHAGATVGLASRDRLSMIYVSMVNGSPLRTMRHDVGTRVEIETSAIGRAFLAGITDEERAFFYQHFERRHGDAWPDLKARIEESLAQVRERGFCFVDGEWQKDMRAVAAPIVSPDSSTVMAINCVAPSFQIDAEVFEKDIGPRLAHMCTGLTPMMGA
ncbi:IclR family transcriptional regulator [Mameliella sp. AT18]|uniref:IclR family transcriptional regulator n=1 Tax=Mameliella sp. AT18 TaxID=3028385 RepID=UPI00237B6675|nr:IclR family transcriptional regulator [Mameliella sp. AT18]MDD9731410.1 IclR family transcriptional regulator [Mameliella sp. AT18]